MHRARRGATWGADMDEQVLQAMAKWPKVPACFGWLGLDARGHWYMRDDAAQRAGSFPQSKGSRLQHDVLVAFIGRNYAADDAGRWYFQNGPQRVYVALEAAPYVWLSDGRDGWRSHTGIAVDAHAVHAWLDEHGRLFLQTDVGFGIVHSAHMLDAAQALQDGAWPEPQPMAFMDAPGKFGYVLDPGE